MDHQHPDSLENVGDIRSARTGVAVIVHHVRKQGYGLVFAQILLIEPLSVEVAWLNHVII